MTYHAGRHFLQLFRTADLKAEYDTGTQLKYAMPQGLAAMVFRLNIWMDILMLGYLVDDKEIGLYKIAASLALLGGRSGLTRLLAARGLPCRALARAAKPSAQA